MGDGASSTELSGRAPGLLVAWSGAAPTHLVHRVEAGGLVVGRELAGLGNLDPRLSRQHARVRRTHDGFSVTDLGSRNGTHVDGEVIASAEVHVAAPCVVRAGHTVGVLLDDVRAFEGAAPHARADDIVGVRRALAHARLRALAPGADVVVLVAEPGCGADPAIVAFHAAAGGGPLRELAPAAQDVAESVAWWRGAGASPPLVLGAHGGTLVLHGPTALDADAQAVLATALATGELVVGAHRHPLRARLVCVVSPAELDDLREAVAAGRFRDDLWHHLHVRVELPSIDDCPDEVARWVAAQVAAVAPSLAVHATLVEACLRRAWPDHVDGLRRAVARAASLAHRTGRPAVRAEHLETGADSLASLSGAVTVAPSLVATLGGPRDAVGDGLDEAEVAAAIAAASGDARKAAALLGIHRNRLRRYVATRPALAAGLRAVDPDDGGRP